MRVCKSNLKVNQRLAIFACTVELSSRCDLLLSNAESRCSILLLCSQFEAQKTTEAKANELRLQMLWTIHGTQDNILRTCVCVRSSTHLRGLMLCCLECLGGSAVWVETNIPTPKGVRMYERQSQPGVDLGASSPFSFTTFTTVRSLLALLI